jgi:hypothetical protein
VRKQRLILIRDCAARQMNHSQKAIVPENHVNKNQAATSVSRVIMRIEAHYILGAIAIGIGASLIMDLWNLFLKRAFNIPSLNYCLLGRWLRHMPGGTFRHASITDAPQKPFECTVGWIAHYTIGVVFALVFVAFASGDWLESPTLLPALLYGIGTVVFPLFIMQPSFGLGIAASRTPNPTQARLKSLATHTVFGVGLYVCALGVSTVLRVHG